MANKRIVELNNLDGKISSEDLFLVQDVSPISESKNITWGNLMTAIAVSASVESASYALTSSYSHLIISASWASASLSSSYSLAGSGSGIYAITSSYSFSSSYALSASYASGSGVTAGTSNYAISSSYANSGSNALSASSAISASSASGSNVFALSSSYGFSSSYSHLATNSDYSSNGIETGYMVLYAGENVDQFESSGQYLVCNGKDVFVSDYQGLYDVIGKKFGYYPACTMTAQRTTVNQSVTVTVDHDDVNIYGYALGSGIITFTIGSPVSNGFWTVTSAKTGTTRILSNATSSAVFGGLGADTYLFTITEQNSGISNTYSTNIHVNGTNYDEVISLGPLPLMSFYPSSNVEYSSKFTVTEVTTDQTVDCQLIQTAPSSIIVGTTASLILAEDQPFTCSIFRHSGSYYNIPSASLKRSSQVLRFSGVNSSGFPTTSSAFGDAFFVPNVNATGSIPENLSPKNSHITQSGYRSAFSYLIKT